MAAPEHQCSGMSVRLTIAGMPEMAVYRYDFPVPVQAAWSVDGTPADCVKVALHALLDFRPDVVLSGVNDGMNAGHDVCYSGTVGAATEAALNGIHTVAFSMGKASAVDVAEQNLPAMLEELLFAPLNPGELWNVNFPPCGGVSQRSTRSMKTTTPACARKTAYSILRLCQRFSPAKKRRKEATSTPC